MIHVSHGMLHPNRSYCGVLINKCLSTVPLVQQEEALERWRPWREKKKKDWKTLHESPWKNHISFHSFLCSAFPGRNIVFGKEKVLPCAKLYILRNSRRISKVKFMVPKPVETQSLSTKGATSEEFYTSSGVSASQQSGKTQQDSTHLWVEVFS